LQASCYPWPTPWHVFLEESTLGRRLGRLPFIRQRYLRSWAHDKERATPWLLGAALALRRDAFRSVGGFDERYFMYLEEVDLCARLRATGWQVHFTPRAEVIHVGGASTSQYGWEMAERYFASLALFYRDHYGPPRQLALAVLARLILGLRHWRARRRQSEAGP
jgi:GT2 family glycosyltransferase